MAEGEHYTLMDTLQKTAKFPDAKEVITLDGLRVEYADGFGLARPSNTTPVIVLRFEADTAAALERSRLISAVCCTTRPLRSPCRSEPGLNTPHPRSLHVIGGKGSGGAERFAVRLINALARRGEPVAAVTVAGGEIAGMIDPAVRQYHAPMLGSWDRWSRWKIHRAIRDFHPDVVQTYMGRATRVHACRADACRCIWRGWAVSTISKAIATHTPGSATHAAFATISWKTACRNRACSTWGIS